MKSVASVPVLVVVVVIAAGSLGFSAEIPVGTLDTAISSDGRCSLIEAMVNANDDLATHPDCVAGSGADIINLMGGQHVLLDVHDTSFGPSGLPAVTGDLTINGRIGRDVRGATVIARARGGPDFRLLHVTSGARLVLNDVTLEGGSAGSYRGGALLNLGGSVVLNRCKVIDNEARSGGGLANQSGSMLLVDSEVTANRASVSGGGVANLTGAGDAMVIALRSAITANAADRDGGGVTNWAGYGRTGSVELVDCTVAGNRAGGGGGGVAQIDPAGYARLAVIGGSISDNVAAEHGGGVSSWTRQAGNSSVIDIRRAEISRNQALDGGGGGVLAWLERTSLVVTESTIDGNVAGNGRGGGVSLGEGATLDLRRSTVSFNVAEGVSAPAGSGGGLAITDATAAISLCTISGNRAMGGGGGVWASTDAEWAAQGASVTLSDSTVFENEAEGLGGGVAAEYIDGAGVARLEMMGSLVGRNLDVRGAGNCSAAFPAELATDGRNLVDDLTCRVGMSSEDGGRPGPRSPGDVVVHDLMLSTLGDFGGPTLTHMPLEDSPAIDMGSGGGMRSCIDQRGYPRTADGDFDGGCICDAGAVEAGSLLEPSRDHHDDW